MILSEVALEGFKIKKKHFEFDLTCFNLSTSSLWINWFIVTDLKSDDFVLKLLKFIYEH